MEFLVPAALTAGALVCLVAVFVRRPDPHHTWMLGMMERVLDGAPSTFDLHSGLHLRRETAGRASGFAHLNPWTTASDSGIAPSKTHGSQ